MEIKQEESWVLRQMGSGKRLSILALALLMTTGIAPMKASAKETAIRFSITSQSLSDALVQLGEQASLQIVYLPEVVQGLTAPAVSGSMTPDEALQRLLAGTGITFGRNGRSVSLSRPSSVSGEQATELDAVTVSAAS